MDDRCIGSVGIALQAALERAGKTADELASKKGTYGDGVAQLADFRARRCPDPFKRAFETAEYAEHRARQENRDRDWRTDGLLRAYRCPCGRWHLSTKAARAA